MLTLVDKKLLDRGINIRYRFDGGLSQTARLRSQKNTRSRYVTKLQYADDIALLGDSATALRRSTDTFVEAYGALDMKVNVEKMKKMQINCTEDHEVTKIGSEAIEDVNEFNYAGNIVTRDGSLTVEIDQRLRKTSSARFHLRKRVFGNADLRVGINLPSTGPW